MSRPRYFRRIFALFLAAAIVPAAAVSAMYTALAGAALRREAESRLDSEAAAFAAAVASIADSCARDLAVVASDPAVLAALRDPGKPDPAVVARAFRRLLSAFPRFDGPAEASILSADGSLSICLGEPQADRNIAAYGSWGIFRALATQGMAIAPRQGVLSDGSPSAFSIGIAIRDDSATPLGYALADVRRAELSAAAAASGIQGGAAVVFSSGKIVFDRADPSREGRYLDEADAYAAPARYATAKASGAGSDFTVRADAPTELYEGFGASARNVAFIGLAVSIAIASALALRASSSVTEPVLAMARSMRLVEAGDLSIRIRPSGDDELGDLARSFNAMTEELNTLLKSAVERQELLREAELRALAAQMNPHFLHNTLASIKSLAKLGRAPEIAEVVSRLGKILRAGAERREGMSTIGESLGNVMDYLSIEKVRFGDRFSFDIDVDPAIEGTPIPPLTLEPLAENALTHGLERKRGHGRLAITGRSDGDDVVLSFRDDGPGIDDAKMEALALSLATAQPPSGNAGMGLLGTNRRIALEYGPGYGLSIGRPEGSGRGFSVELRLPRGGDR